MAVLGIDTSNYTTSAALYESDCDALRMEKKLLPVREGAVGLRQSDAVFAHVKQLDQMVSALFDGCHPAIEAVGVSTQPRRAEGSYMPCFLVGEMTARSIAAVLDVPLYPCSHQEGHIAAAAYSAGRMDLLDQPFYAFHVSGGTTDLLLVEPDQTHILHITLLGSSLDLKAGQAVDRIGRMLGLAFPAGPALDELARQWSDSIRVRASVDGLDCHLSGIENQCRKLLDEGRESAYIARYCIESIKAALAAMTERVCAQYGHKPLLYAGGVMANSIIRQDFTERFHGCFAEPAFSSDNACGVALLAAKRNQN